MTIYKGREIFTSGLLYEIWWTKEWDPKNPDDVVLGTDKVRYLFDKILEEEGKIHAWVFKPKRKKLFSSYREYLLHREYPGVDDSMTVNEIYRNIFKDRILIIRTKPYLVRQILYGYVRKYSGIFDEKTKKLFFSLHRDDIIIPDSVFFQDNELLANIGGDGDSVSFLMEPTAKKPDGSHDCIQVR